MIKKLLLTALLAMWIVVGCGKMEDLTGSGSVTNSKMPNNTSVPNEETEEEQENREVILNQEYKFNDGIVNMVLSKDVEEKYYFSILVKTDTKWKAAYAYTAYTKATSIDDMDKLNPTVLASCGDITITPLYSYRKNGDGDTEQIDSTQWLANAIEEAPSDKLNKFSDKLTSFLTDFLSK